MAQVFIELEGPDAGKLTRVTVWDREDEQSVHLDMTGVSQTSDVLELIAENIGSRGFDILKAAHMNGDVVTLDGEIVPLDQIAASLKLGATAPGM